MGTSTNYTSTKWSAQKTEATNAAGGGPVSQAKAEQLLAGFIHQMQQPGILGFGTPLGGGGGAGGSGGGVSGGGGSGGGGGGSRGGTQSLGGSGSARTVARSLGSFLSSVETKGFADALADCGLTRIDGMTPDQIAMALAELLGGPASLIDQTALREALLTMVQQWTQGIKTVAEMAAAMAAIAKDIGAVLRAFFGHYIFEVFRTVSYGNLLERHGCERAEGMVQQIRDFIDAKLTVATSSHDFKSVEWNGPSGAAIIDGIVKDTTEIFGGAKK